MVDVVVGGRGEVVDVRISEWWRDELTPSGLADAILDAYRAAVTEAITRPDPGPASDVRPMEELDWGDDRAWREGVRRRLDRAAETLDEIHRLRSGQAGRTVGGPDGIVRLELAGRTVSRVELDTYAALENTPGRIAADALAAFREI